MLCTYCLKWRLGVIIKNASDVLNYPATAPADIFSNYQPLKP